MKKNKNVIIFSDTHDWHSNQLKKELKKLNCKVSCLSLDDCFINTKKNIIFIFLDMLINYLTDVLLEL